MLEFQERDAPDFHIFTSESIDRDAVALACYRIVGGADARHLQAGTRIDLFRKFAARGSYVMKYAAKIEQKTVPAEFQNMGRFWGTWGNPEICRKVTLPLPAAKHLMRTTEYAYTMRFKTIF